MRLLLYSSLAVLSILALNTQPVQAWGFAPIFIRLPIWSNCCWLWRLFGWCQQSGGQSNAVQTTPPIVCGTGTFLWNGQCLTTTQKCTAAPNSGTYASTSGPCTCAPPGQSLAGKTECKPPPANGNFHCETAGPNGGSSSCIIDCVPGYMSTDGVTCIKAKLKANDCAPDLVGTTTIGGPCTCIPVGTAPTVTLHPCQNMIYNTAATPPGFHGDIACTPQVGAVATCTPDCDPGYQAFGQGGCQ